MLGVAMNDHTDEDGTTVFQRPARRASTASCRSG
jgi:hypothetical protein